MKGRRLAALLCVLLVHALAVYQLIQVPRREPVAVTRDEFRSVPIVLDEPTAAPGQTAISLPDSALRPAPAEVNAPLGPPSAADSPPDTSHVDWPEEGKKAAARVLAREAEAARIAKLFAGPGGTWASLTKRQRSKLNKFRFRPGVMGLEYDAQGNLIYHISDGCVIVNSMFFACAIGKPKVRDDMFDNMREYFDEQRLPPTREGNGTEPEALRPPN
jgi:hypothetical protein